MVCEGLRRLLVVEVRKEVLPATVGLREERDVVSMRERRRRFLGG